MAGLGVARHGTARRGMANHGSSGLARQSSAGHGESRQQWQGAAGYGSVWRGTSRQAQLGSCTQPTGCVTLPIEWQNPSLVGGFSAFRR